MLIIGNPSPRFAAALDVIRDHLHQTIASKQIGDSKSWCIYCSLVVQDFLRLCGFDASVASVAALFGINGKAIGGIGLPGSKTDEPNKWAGHLVVLIPSEGYVVDTTLYDNCPSRWTGPRGMIAAQVVSPGKTIFDLPVLASLAARTEESEFGIVWLDRKDNDSWKESTSAKENLRKGLVKQLFSELKNSSVVPGNCNVTAVGRDRQPGLPGVDVGNEA